MFRSARRRQISTSAGIVVVAWVIMAATGNVMADGAPDAAIAELERLQGLDSGDRYERQVEILREIAARKHEAVEPLFEAIRFRSGSVDAYDWTLRDLLAEKCREFPDLFSEIITDEKADQTKRWYAVHAVRLAAEKRCFPATVKVFNNPTEPQSLRIQVLMSLMGREDVAPEDVKALVKGVVVLLREHPRNQNLARIISLAEYGRMEEAVPDLIALLDQTKVYSHTVVNDGERAPNRISDKAHQALKTITGKALPNDKAQWEKDAGLRPKEKRGKDK